MVYQSLEVVLAYDVKICCGTNESIAIFTSLWRNGSNLFGMGANTRGKKVFAGHSINT
jgi:hypothetical protein